MRGRADAVVLPGSAEEVAGVVRWCYANDVPMVPRGGGTGYAAGAVPLEGGVVLALDRLRRVRSFEPLLWRMGSRPACPRRRCGGGAGERPPVPARPGCGGAVADRRQRGHERRRAARVQVRRHRRLGDGRRGGGRARRARCGSARAEGRGRVRPGQPARRLRGDARRDHGGLAALPAPEAAWPVAAFYAGTGAGCAAIQRVLGNGLPVAALEFLDAATVRLAGSGFPGELADGFLVVAEADGTAAGAAALRDDVLAVLAEGALSTWTPETPAETAAFWRWRDGVALRVQAHRGGKSSEDLGVPLEHLAEAVEATLAVGRSHGLEAAAGGTPATATCTPPSSSTRADEVARAQASAEELFALATRLGGTISGEHGVGLVKGGRLGLQWGEAALDLHEAVKRAFDPKNLFNPGKKRAR